METGSIMHEEINPEKKRRKRAKKSEESSPEVRESLAEIQKMEQERVAEEKTAKTDPEKRFKKGVEKLRETNLNALEAKRKVEEDRLIEEARAELRKRYEEREALGKRKDEGIEVKVTVEEPVSLNLEAVSRQEVENDLLTLPWFIEPELKKTAINERMAAQHRAEKLLTREQAKELSGNPLEIAFFTSGEDPITLSDRVALQEEIDMASEAQGYKIDFSDWMKMEKDLRSLEEGGKQAPMKMETSEERVQALFAFESALRRSRLEAMDKAHEEFPDSFPFAAQDFENLLKQVAALENIVKKEKKNRKIKEMFKRFIAGPSKLEIELQKAKAELESWDEKIADFIDSGKSKLASKYLTSRQADLRSLENRVMKFLTR